MNRILGIIIGYILMIIGFSYFILYLNLFSFGVSLKNYICFLFTRYECYFFIIGFIMFNYFKYRKGINK